MVTVPGRDSRGALGIWMNGQQVGVWDQGRGSGSLQYARAWMQSPQGRPLSLSLPFLPDGGLHRGAAVANYFENLLPDSDQIRRRIGQRVRAKSTRAFDLLWELGRDCAGAVQLVPEGKAPDDAERIDCVALTEHDVAQVLRGVTSVAAFGQEGGEGFRLSLAGAQEKTALLWHEGRWCRALKATPTTHLFKLPLGLVGHMQADFASSVENEWLCSELLHAFGLSIARTRIGVFEDQKALIVERFDRQPSADGRWWIRRPQEDLCQALGLPPERKYESDGGPGVLAVMDLLGRSEQPEQDRQAFFASQLLFWLLAAIDGHAKNFSLFIGARGSFRLTPLYDVMSAHPALGRGKNQLDPRAAKMAMAVVAANKHYALTEIQPRHWGEMARRCGIEIDAVLGHVLPNVPTVVETVSRSLPDKFPASVSEPIFKGLLATARKLAA